MFIELKSFYNAVKEENIFFFYGEETFFIDKAIDYYEEYIRNNNSINNCNIYNGENIDFKKILSNVLQTTIFDEKKFFIIKNLQNYKDLESSENIILLKKIISECSGNNSLFFSFKGKLEKTSSLCVNQKYLNGQINPNDLKINIDYNKDSRILTVSDNGIGMDEDELENNLGTIAESGSLKFKESQEKDSEIIGQFGVGFYSAFMVAKKVEVLTRKAGSEDAYLWTSEGVDGYTLEKTRKDNPGTDVILYLKDDLEDEDYTTFLDEYTIRRIVKKYSDYIRYPINMEVTNSRLKEGSESEYEDYTEVVTLNSMSYS